MIGRISGLRIDHPDGLYDPCAYFQQLQQKARQILGIELQQEKPLYVLIEKILEHGEELDKSLPVHGTTGYEFMNLLNGIFVQHQNDKVRVSGYKIERSLVSS